MAAKLRSLAYYVGLATVAFFVPGNDLLSGDPAETSTSAQAAAQIQFDNPCKPTPTAVRWPSTWPPEPPILQCEPTEPDGQLPVNEGSDH